MHKVYLGNDRHEWRDVPLEVDERCVVRRVRIPLPLVHFNPSLMWDGTTLRLFTRNSPCGSRIFQCQLDGPDYQPGQLIHLDLPHALARGGQEDPRVFAHQGRWHISYHGVQCVSGTYGDGVRVHQLVARLDQHALKAEQTWKPTYIHENKWEKNWGFFSWMGELFAVYSIKPHLVVHCVGERCYPFSWQDWSPDWFAGHLRGGAAPVRCDGEMWSFFHGALDAAGEPSRIYSLGCYTFEARPPFRPLYYTPKPIALAADPDWPKWLSERAIFPCGAILRGGMWSISCGAHNTHCDIYELDHRKLLQSMVKA